jgi:hypothetical protein
MYLTRYLSPKLNTSLSYDSGEGGADFIVGFNDEQIIIEVGSGEKSYRQIIQTAKKVKSKYNLVVAKDALNYEAEHHAVKIPFEWFLLI